MSFEMSKIRYLLIVAIVLLDQITKFSVRGLMYIGAAFSLFSGSGVMLIIIPIAALLLAIWYMEKHKGEHWTLTLSLCLIISGGLGNLIDRVFMGFVTDMFDFRIWPVFNVADIAVCLGAGFLILYTLAFYGKTSEANNI